MPGLRVCAALLLAAATATARQDTLPTIRITVTLVQMDAVVTDSSGRHIPGLTAADFELRQDGEVRAITNATYVRELPPAAPRDPRQTVPITAHEVQRTVALVVDDLSLSFPSMVRVRDSLRKFVTTAMQPGDLVAIVRTGGGVAILEQFTTDRRVLLEAIDSLKWRFAGRIGLMPIRADTTAAATPGHPEVLDYGVTLRALGSLGTLEQVIHGMRKMPGRKSIVYLSDALSVDSSVNDAMDHITDLANRSAVSIYAIDARGLSVKSPVASAAEDTPGDSLGAMIPGMTETRGASEVRSEEGLLWLARHTGGLFFGNNDIAGSIRHAADDQMGYYLLSYTPKEGTFDNDSAKAKFHRVTLRVKRPGLSVRWKSGFNGVADKPPEDSLTPPPSTREQQLLEALASPFLSNGLKVRLTSLYTDLGKDGPYVQSMLHFDASGIDFTHGNDGLWRAKVDIVTSAYRGLKQPMQQRDRVQNLALPDDIYRMALRQGFQLTITDPVKDPGAYLMRAVVRDQATQRIGSASELVQVPDTRKGQLAVSGVLLKLAPESVLKPGESVDDLAPKDGSGQAWATGGPAVRRFRPGQRVLYVFMVVNPKRKGSAKTTDLVYQARLLRNGAVVYDGPQNPMPEDRSLDPRRMMMGGMLHLTPLFPPGEYLLEILVTDKNAPAKQSHVAQWIDFEVAPLSE